MQNENTPSVHALLTHSNVPAYFNDLIKDRQGWEQEEYLRSNERLYSLLANCYETGWRMNSTKPSAQLLKAAFHEYCETQGFSFKSNTHLIARIVRVVFGMEDRRRISAYAVALKFALQAKVEPADVINYIKQAGGIEEVRRTGGKKKTSIKQRAKQGLAALESPALGEIENDLLSQQFDATNYMDAVLLIATHEPNGKFVIRRMVQNGTAVTAALAALSKTAQEEQREQADATERLNDEAARDQAIQHALAA